MGIILIVIGSFITWEAGMSMWYSKSYKARVAQIMRLARVIAGIAIITTGILMIKGVAL